MPEKEEDQARKQRNLVICSDGTGNRGGVSRGTNVWRLFQAVDLTSQDPEQLVLYDDGVGTEDFKFFKLIAGATGFGLSENIREMYEWLMLNYQPGDRIFLFGFSRGAYTVRSLAGMLHHCGLLVGTELVASKSRQVVKRVYSRYYRGSLLGRLLGRESSYRRPLAATGERYRPPGVDLEEGLLIARPEIHFLGVWDTVGAVGVPGWLQSVILLARSSRYHEVDANNWAHGYQALAIDDERLSFWPEPLPAPRADDENRVHQVWFAGSHSNVGGGYPKDGLAFVSLEWMMTHAKNEGLVFTDEAWSEVRHRANAHDRIYEPRAGLRAYYRYKPREIPKIKSSHEKSKRSAAPLDQVHSSVLERIERVTSNYAPPYLPGGLEIVTTPNVVSTKKNKTRLQRRLHQSDGDRLKRLASLTPKTWVRKTLYWLLLGATSTLLAYGFYLIGRPQPRAGAESAGWQPYAWIQGFADRVVELVPSFLQRMVGGLIAAAIANPGVSLTLLALTVLAFVLRAWLKRSSVRDALAAWHFFRITNEDRTSSGSAESTGS